VAPACYVSGRRLWQAEQMCHQTVETRRGTGRGGERWGRLRQETQRFREFVCRGDAQDWESSRRGDMGAMKVEKNHGLLYHCGNFLMAGSYSWPGAFLREFLIAGSFFHFLMGGVFDRRELIAQ